MDGSDWLDSAIKLLNFLRPKFYNRITWWIVGVGLGLIGATPILERVLIAFFDLQFSLIIPCEINNTIGISLIIIGLIYNLVMNVVDNAYELGLASKNSPSVQSDIMVYKTIMELLPFSEVDSFGRSDFMGSFRRDNYNNIDLYSEKMASPELSFFNDELNKLKSDFDQALEIFLGILARYTYSVQGMKGIYRVPQEWEFDLPEKYKRAKKEINQSQDKFFYCYNELIKGCRRRLGV